MGCFIVTVTCLGVLFRWDSHSIINVALFRFACQRLLFTFTAASSFVVPEAQSGCVCVLLDLYYYFPLPLASLRRPHTVHMFFLTQVLIKLERMESKQVEHQNTISTTDKSSVTWPIFAIK